MIGPGRSRGPETGVHYHRATASCQQDSHQTPSFPGEACVFGQSHYTRPRSFRIQSITRRMSLRDGCSLPHLLLKHTTYRYFQTAQPLFCLHQQGSQQSVCLPRAHRLQRAARTHSSDDRPLKIEGSRDWRPMLFRFRVLPAPQPSDSTLPALPGEVCTLQALPPLARTRRLQRAEAGSYRKNNLPWNMDGSRCRITLYARFSSLPAGQLSDALPPPPALAGEACALVQSHYRLITNPRSLRIHGIARRLL